VFSRLYQEGGQVKIETVGDGSGQYAKMNEVVGPAVFKKIDGVIKQRIIWEFGGFQTPREPLHRSLRMTDTACSGAATADVSEKR
jgi:hypothetical protein